MADTFICARCGETSNLSQAYIVDEQPICENCAYDYTFVCNCCGRRFYNEDDYGNDSISLCESCMDAYYTCCAICDRLILVDDTYENPRHCEEYRCGECYDTEDRYHCIHDYCYKPIPNFYG